ncbi:MAG: hypothetical protein ACREQT_09740 [Candidatus Binataceae bacterium]
MPGAPQPAEELDDTHVPAGDVGRDLFEYGEGALAPAIIDRLRDIDALAARAEAADQIRCKKFCDIRNDPIVTGLDRLVFPKAVDAAPQDCGLRPDASDQFEQRPPRVELVGVLGAIDSRNEAPQLVSIVGFVMIEVIMHCRRPPA